MGKIRIKTLGDESLEKEQKKQAKKRKELKRTVKAPGLKGGERVVAVGPTEEELALLEINESQVSEEKDAKLVKSKKKAKKVKKARQRSNRYNNARILVDKGKFYPLEEALEILSKLGSAKFDETVELHINTLETGVLGNLTLPYGTGKKTRVAIADPSTSSGQAELDELIKKIEGGAIDFDILIATPDSMPKLAKVAKYLGPKGLMPNPKNGTITKNPEEVVKKYEGGQINFKTEAKAPIIHLSLGKISFGKEKLEKNIRTALKTISEGKIKKVVLKSTMSPSIKIDFLKV